jgi:hypothetical protein
MSQGLFIVFKGGERVRYLDRVKKSEEKKENSPFAVLLNGLVKSNIEHKGQKEVPVLRGGVSESKSIKLGWKRIQLENSEKRKFQTFSTQKLTKGKKGRVSESKFIIENLEKRKFQKINLKESKLPKKHQMKKIFLGGLHVEKRESQKNGRIQGRETKGISQLQKLKKSNLVLKEILRKLIGRKKKVSPIRSKNEMYKIKNKNYSPHKVPVSSENFKIGANQLPNLVKRRTISNFKIVKEKTENLKFKKKELPKSSSNTFNFDSYSYKTSDTKLENNFKSDFQLPQSKSESIKDFVKSHYEPIEGVVRFYAKLSDESSLKVLINGRLGIAKLLFISNQSNFPLNSTTIQNLINNLNSLGFSNVSVGYNSYSGEERNGGNQNFKGNRNFKFLPPSELEPDDEEFVVRSGIDIVV